MKKILLILGAALSGTVALAQFTVDAEIRPRAEFRNGYKGSLVDGDKPAVFVSQRSRLNFGYKKDKLQLGISLQDARIWGQEKNSIFNNTDASTVLHEGWASWATSRNTYLKLGRQEVGIEDERLLTKGGWNQQAQSLDGAYFAYDSLFQLQAFVSVNNNNTLDKNGFTTEESTYSSYVINTNALNTSTNTVTTNPKSLMNDKTFNFLVLKKEFGPFTPALVSVVKGAQDVKTINTLYGKYTNGAYLYYDNDSAKFHAKVFGFYQAGKAAIATGGSQEVKAYLVGASVWKEIGLYTPTLGCDIMSGNKLLSNSVDASKNNVNDDAVENQFDYTPGTAHSYYGIIDYFPMTLSKKTGFINPYLKNKVKFNAKWAVGLDFLYFMSPNDFYDKTGAAMDKNLGIETDLVVTYTASKECNVQLGYSAINATETLKTMQSADKKALGQWAWVMVSFKPQLFKSN